MTTGSVGVSVEASWGPQLERRKERRKLALSRVEGKIDKVCFINYL
jgi:hypothetical protein